MERAGNRGLRETVVRSSRDILRFSALLISVVTATAALSGCGGTSDTTSTVAGPPSAQAGSATAAEARRYIARAEPICRRSVDEVESLGERFAEAPLGATTYGGTIADGLVRPGIEVLSRKASRLRAIAPAPESADLHVYLGLFDPIVELSRQLLLASEANDGSRSRELELMIAGLGHEQSDAGRRFGFDLCALTFTESLGGEG